jgi:hypothetical protein
LTRDKHSSSLALIHWLETGELMTLTQIATVLGLSDSDNGKICVEIEDYLYGIVKILLPVVTIDNQWFNFLYVCNF